MRKTIAAVIAAASLLLASGCASQAHNEKHDWEVMAVVLAHNPESHTIAMRITSAQRGVWAVMDSEGEELTTIYDVGVLICTDGAAVVGAMPEGQHIHLYGTAGELGGRYTKFIATECPEYPWSN